MTETIILIITIIAFFFMWRGIHRFFLPSEIVDVKNESNYDERQSKIFMEVFAKSFVGLVFVLSISFIFRTSGLVDANRSLIGKYPEGVFLVITLVMVVLSYFSIKQKYTSKD